MDGRENEAPINSSKQEEKRREERKRRSSNQGEVLMVAGAIREFKKKKYKQTQPRSQTKSKKQASKRRSEKREAKAAWWGEIQTNPNTNMPFIRWVGVFVLFSLCFCLFLCPVFCCPHNQRQSAMFSVNARICNDFKGFPCRTCF